MTEGHARDVRIINAWVAGIALVGGIGVALGGPSPTGSTLVDVLLLVSAVGLCIAAIATAPWLRRWGATRGPIITAVVLAVAVQPLARLGNLRYFGVSSVIGIAPVLALTLLAIQRRSGQRRLQLWGVFGGIVALSILALLGFGVAAAAARPELTRGTDEAKHALESLKAGDFASARRGFDLAADLLDRAGDDLGAPWAQPARFVPVLAQHRRAAVDLAESAEAVSVTISDVLGQIDFDRLRIVNGAIDIAAVRDLQDPLARLNTAIDDLDSTVDSIDNPWLVQPIRTRLATLTEKIDKQQADGNRAAAAVERAPAMLGAAGKRVYFIAFTTPAEGRGLGGAMGNWAEVTIDAGHLSVTGVGRTADLAAGGDPEHWRRITSSPHFPDVAKSIAEDYATYSGHAVDGVFAMDVYTVAGLMTLTGPVNLTAIPQTVTAQDVTKFLLSDQYAIAQDRPDRIDLLEEVAGTTIARLLTSTLPAPPDLIELLSPYAAQGRLVGWSSHGIEEDLFEQMRISGELPELDGADGLAIVMNNVGNNKIDYYLTGEVGYTVDTDDESGTATATLDIALHNGAPPGVSEPSIVFGQTEGIPPGTNLMELNVYSAMPVVSVTVDAVDRPPGTVSVHRDFRVTTLNLQIPGQSTAAITVRLAGPLDLSDGYHLFLRTGPTVSPLDTSLIVDEAIVEDLGARAGVTEI